MLLLLLMTFALQCLAHDSGPVTACLGCTAGEDCAALDAIYSYTKCPPPMVKAGSACAIWADGRRGCVNVEQCLLVDKLDEATSRALARRYEQSRVVQPVFTSAYTPFVPINRLKRSGLDASLFLKFSTVKNADRIAYCCQDSFCNWQLPDMSFDGARSLYLPYVATALGLIAFVCIGGVAFAIYSIVSTVIKQCRLQSASGAPPPSRRESTVLESTTFSRVSAAHLNSSVQLQGS